MNARIRYWAATFCAATALAVFSVSAPAAVARTSDGFNGSIRSGTCQKPTDRVHVDLESESGPAVKPYRAKSPTGGKDVVLGYYGNPDAPGFSVDTIYTDQRFSLVVTDARRNKPVACGDILQPTAERYTRAGTALVQLLPIEDSGVQGVAVLQRTAMQRELDITPTRVRIVLSTDADIEPSRSAGFNGRVQSGTCAEPTGKVRVQLTSHRDHDVNPYRAEPHGATASVTLAYYGVPTVRGVSVDAIYTEQRFTLVLTGVGSQARKVCGEILEPADDDFTEAGLALVRLDPIDDSGVHGYALMERTPMQRELDIVPTVARIVVFAPPARP